MKETIKIARFTRLNFIRRS